MRGMRGRSLKRLREAVRRELIRKAIELRASGTIA
jgi:hypothetical protein